MARGFKANFQSKKWKFKLGYICAWIFTFIIFCVGVWALVPGPVICGCDEFYAYDDQTVPKSILISQFGEPCANSGQTKCKQYQGNKRIQCSVYFLDGADNICKPQHVKTEYTEGDAFATDNGLFYMGIAFLILVFFCCGSIGSVSWKLEDGTL